MFIHKPGNKRGTSNKHPFEKEKETAYHIFQVSSFPVLDPIWSMYGICTCPIKVNQTYVCGKYTSPMDAMGWKDEIKVTNSVVLFPPFMFFRKEELDHLTGREGQNLGHQKTTCAEPKVSPKKDECNLWPEIPKGPQMMCNGFLVDRANIFYNWCWEFFSWYHFLHDSSWIIMVYQLVRFISLLCAWWFVRADQEGRKRKWTVFCGGGTADGRNPVNQLCLLTNLYYTGIYVSNKSIHTYNIYIYREYDCMHVYNILLFEILSIWTHFFGTYRTLRIDAVARDTKVQSTSFNTSKNETLVIQKGFWFPGTNTSRFANQPLNFWGWISPGKDRWRANSHVLVKIISPFKSPPFGGCTIYFPDGIHGRKNQV